MFDQCGKMTLTAYTEKMKELPLLSLFCSCLRREPQVKPNKTKAPTDVVDLNLCIIKDMEVVEMNKRTSGQAFEVILKPPSFDGLAEVTAIVPQHRDVSRGESQRNLQVPEEKRKCQDAELPKRPVDTWVQKVMQSPAEENQNCEQETETEEGSTETNPAATVQSQQEKGKHPQEVP